MSLTQVAPGLLNTTAQYYGFKNRVINGAMVIDQRNAGAAVTINGANSYTVDRWFCGFITGGSFTMQQVADAPAGFGYSMKYTTVSTTTASDEAVFNQRVEASNVIDWNWGTSSGQTINASFWVKANNTGTYNASVVFYGGTSTYYYLIPYTVSSANTWTQISLQIPPPPTAAGAYANALNSTYTIFTPFVISSSGWTTYGTANTWQTTSSNNYKASSAAFNLASTSSATFQVTGVQLEVGTQATAFDYRPYGTELQLCQRYYYAIFNPSSAQGYSSNPVQAGSSSTSGNFGIAIKPPVSMRSTSFSVNWSNPSNNIGWNWTGSGSGYFTSSAPTTYSGSNAECFPMYAVGNATGSSGTFSQGSLMWLYCWSTGAVFGISTEL
jgi:hypothetical protein